MIETDIEKADGELRTMLASMVNEPVLDAMRRGNDAVTEQFSEELRAESSAIIRQIEKKLAGVRDEIDEVRSKVAQLQADSAASRHDVGQRLADIATGVDASASVAGQLSAKVRDALVLDFADGARRLDEAVVILKAANDMVEQALRLALEDVMNRLAAADQQRINDRDDRMRDFRSLRVLVMAVGAIAACGVVALLVHALGH